MAIFSKGDDPLHVLIYLDIEGKERVERDLLFSAGCRSRSRCPSSSLPDCDDNDNDNEFEFEFEL